VDELSTSQRRLALAVREYRTVSGSRLGDPQVEQYEVRVLTIGQGERVARDLVRCAPRRFASNPGRTLLAVGGDAVHVQIDDCPNAGLEAITTYDFTASSHAPTRSVVPGQRLIKAAGDQVLVYEPVGGDAVVFDHRRRAETSRASAATLGGRVFAPDVQEDGTLIASIEKPRPDRPPLHEAVLIPPPGNAARQLAGPSRLFPALISDDIALLSGRPATLRLFTVAGAQRLLTRYGANPPSDMEGTRVVFDFPRCTGRARLVVDLSQAKLPLGRERCPLRLNRAPRLSGATVRVSVRCTGYTDGVGCAGPLRLQLNDRRRTTIGHGRANHYGRGTIRLNATGRRVLARSRHPTAILTAKTRDIAERVETRTARVVLR